MKPDHTPTDSGTERERESPPGGRGRRGRVDQIIANDPTARNASPELSAEPAGRGGEQREEPEQEQADGDDDQEASEDGGGGVLGGVLSDGFSLPDSASDQAREATSEARPRTRSLDMARQSGQNPALVEDLKSLVGDVSEQLGEFFR